MMRPVGQYFARLVGSGVESAKRRPVISAGLGLAVALLIGGILGTDPGNVAEWVGGIGTVGAVSVALIEASDSRRRRVEADEQADETRRLQMEADRVAAQRERRAQAERVTAWCSNRDTFVEIPDGASEFAALIDDRDHFDEIVVSVRNGSELPVYDAVVSTGYWPEDVDAPLNARTHIVDSRPIGPGELLRIETNRVPGRDAEVWPPIQIEFTDAAGVHWRRNPNGRLDEVETNQFSTRRRLRMYREFQRSGTTSDLPLQSDAAEGSDGAGLPDSG